MDKRFKNSLVLGKIYGMHLGHLYLIDTAIQNSEKVNIIICHRPSQTIPGNVRYDVIKNIYKDNPNVIVHLMDDSHLPQYDYECNSLDEFYGKWVPEVYKIVNNFDAVFTSEDYGDDFARYLGVEHFLVDKERVKYPISGTKVRSDPFGSWEFIPKEMRPYFIKRIAIMGPESVGKSTLSKNLSEYFNTNFVEEYGRTVYENNGNKITIDDFIPISKGRQILEDSAIIESNKLIFCDTEDITTYIFSKMYHPNEYQKVENWFIKTISNKKKYDMYILLKADCDVVQDGTRNFLTERQEHYEVIKKELIKNSCSFIEIGGDWKNRLEESLQKLKLYFNI